MRARLRSAAAMLAAWACCLACMAPARAACPPRSDHLVAGDAVSNDLFGTSVDIDGDVIVVGANGCDDGGNSAGAAYVFRWNGGTWVEEAKLTASDPLVGAGFGWGVAISGDTVLVSARRNDGTATDQPGVAYFFRYTGSAWTQEARVEASDGVPTNEFGMSVALDGDTALIGAPGDDWVSDNNTPGAAYVFVRSGSAWSEQAKFTAAGGRLNDRFGYAVALDGNRAVVGARLHDATARDAGAAFVYERSGTIWTETATLLGSGGLTFDGCGTAVAVSGNTIAATCPGDDTTAPAGGAVRVYVNGPTGWTQQARVAPQDVDGGLDDTLGNSVALEGNTLIIGSWQDDDGAFNGGAAFIYDRSGSAWSLRSKHLSSAPASHDWLGFAVAIGAGTVVAGATRADDRATDAGMADVIDACVQIDLLRNASLTGRSFTQMRAVLTPGADPVLDPSRDAFRADIGALPSILAPSDALPVGEGTSGVLTFYELTGSSGILHAARQGADVLLSGW